jgi:hypothetical protein
MSSGSVNRFAKTKLCPPTQSQLSISLAAYPIENSSEAMSHRKCESALLKHTSLPDSKHHDFCTYFTQGHGPEVPVPHHFSVRSEVHGFSRAFYLVAEELIN